MPQRLPISPKCKTKRWVRGGKSIVLIFLNFQYFLKVQELMGCGVEKPVLA
jgi:hypothetical protein